MRTPARFVSSVTRRHFVAASAATIGAPWFVPSHVLGGNGQVGPHDKINVGLIGIGKMMHDSHLPHLVKMPEVKVVAVCDVDTTRRESGKKRVDETYENTDCAMYDDYRELLKRDGLDAILCITTTAKFSRVPTSTPSSSSRPTTGTPSWPSTLPKPGKISTAKNR